jgi:predicted transcriptional regulator
MSATVSISETTKQRLDHEAGRVDESADQLADKAIRFYLRARDDERHLLERRIKEADEGKFISSEAMLRWIGSWGTDNELPLPEPDLDFGPRTT